MNFDADKEIGLYFLTGLRIVIDRLDKSEDKKKLLKILQDISIIFTRFSFELEV
jgi:hypothetical protein